MLRRENVCVVLYWLLLRWCDHSGRHRRQLLLRLRMQVAPPLLAFLEPLKMAFILTPVYVGQDQLRLWVVLERLGHHRWRLRPCHSVVVEVDLVLGRRVDHRTEDVLLA